MPEASVQCVVTSPPYWGLRDYGVDGQIGLERTPEEYVAKMVAVFEEVRRVLKADGVLWLNLGDCYATGGGSVGNHPGGGEQGARWMGDVTRHRDQKRRPDQNGRGEAQPTMKGHRGPRGGNEGKHGYAAAGAGVGPMTQPNRMPIEGLTIEGLKPKDLVGIPWRVAFALQASGWWLRQEVIWHKPNPMPESVLDRPTRAHESVFLLTKSAKYFYDAEAIKEPAVGDHPRNGVPGTVIQSPGQAVQKGISSLRSSGTKDKQRGHSRRHAGFNARWDSMSRAEQTSGKRNKRSVWTIPPAQFRDAHFAVMPEELALLCVLSGTRAGDLVLDPFAGAGTTGVAAEKTGRKFIGIELNASNVAMAHARIRNVAPLFREACAE